MMSTTEWRRRHCTGWVLAVAMVVVGLGVFAGNCWADGAINVVTDPEGATVTVDTDQEGVTPCTLQVPVGTRKVKIKLRAFIAANKTVEVQDGETVELNVKLTPIPTTMLEIDRLYAKDDISTHFAALHP